MRRDNPTILARVNRRVEKEEKKFDSIRKMRDKGRISDTEFYNRFLDVDRKINSLRSELYWRAADSATPFVEHALLAKRVRGAAREVAALPEGSQKDYARERLSKEQYELDRLNQDFSARLIKSSDPVSKKITRILSDINTKRALRERRSNL